MPKSRHRNRASTRLDARPAKQRPWVKWLALILPAALLLGTLAGIFGAGSAAAVPVTTGAPPSGAYAP